jgi:ribosomal protein L29
MATKKIDITTASVEELEQLIKQLRASQAREAKEAANSSKKDPIKTSKRAGGMIKGFSPIARPQRFKGTF